MAKVAALVEGRGGQGQHIEVTASESAFAEQVEAFGNGGVWVLWFCGKARAEEDAVHEEEELPERDR